MRKKTDKTTRETRRASYDAVAFVLVSFGLEGMVTTYERREK